MKKTLLSLFFLGFMGSTMAQTDTVPPTLVCKNQYVPTDVRMYECWSTVPAINLLDTVYDDTNGPIALGMQYDCKTTGFPMDSFLTFYTGSRLVEVWAKDSAGNTSSCVARVTIYEQGFCDPGFYQYKVTTPEWRSLPNTTIIVDSGNCIFDSIHFELHTTATNGQYEYLIGYIGEGFKTTITPYRDQNALNGITTYDLLLIQKHILGIQPIDSPYGLIAADVNLDGQINAGDLLLLRKLLLGIITKLPHGKSWRFVQKKHQFMNPSNPFVPPFPENFYYTGPIPNYWLFDPIEFIGIKLGDVNFSADPND